MVCNIHLIKWIINHTMSNHRAGSDTNDIEDGSHAVLNDSHITETQDDDVISASGSSQGISSANGNSSLLTGDFQLYLPDFNNLIGRFDRKESTSRSSNYQSAFSHESNSDISYDSENSGEVYLNTKIKSKSPSKSDTSDELVYMDAEEFDGENEDEDVRIYAQMSRAANDAINSSYEIYETSEQESSFIKRLDKPLQFEEDDSVKNMTYGRRLALRLAKYSWYNPSIRLHKMKYENYEGEEVELRQCSSSRDTEAPRLESAWAYFEHMTLPRYIIGPKKKLTFQERLKRLLPFTEGRKMNVAVPGETMYYTKLYSPLSTPLNQMGDFGLGIGLYFATLRGLFVLMIVCSLMNIPNIIYFASESYSNGQANVSWYLKGSAVCNLQSWVPCPGCNMDDFRDKSRIQLSTSDEHSMTFALKNDCDGSIWRVGMVNFGTTLLVLVGFVIIAFYLGHMEVQFDEDEQTAQDYSIAIRNPPIDAIDPQEWINFLKEAFPECTITCCTVAVDNDELVHSLVKRREILRAIKDSLPDEKKDLSLENIKKVADQIRKNRNSLQRLFAKFISGIPEYEKALLDLNDRIVKLCDETYPASSVFFTLETEKWQRYILDNLVVAPVHISKNNIGVLKNPKYLFRGKHMLNVVEPAEPSTIRWLDLDVTTKDHVLKLVFTAIMVGIIAVVATILTVIYDKEPTSFAIANSLTNAIIPSVAKILSIFEKHRNEEDRQVWLFIRIAMFRMFNTVILINWFITPFTSSIMDGPSNLLGSVYTIFFAEIVTSNVLQLLDISENFKRHFLAPRAKTQEKMNLHMRGAEIFIAERYTNMVKLLFLALWYCPLYPSVLIMCAIALFVSYYVDRFSLMRSWKPAPKLGRSISRFTRRIIFPLMLVFMAFVASTSWADFPYDNLCICTNADDCPIFPGTYNFTAIDFAYPNDQVTIGMLDPVYKFCTNEQEWMTGQQERLTQYFARLNFSVVGLISLVILTVLVLFIRRYYVRNLEFVGEPQAQRFSDVASRTAYIPEIKSAAFAYPFICCPVDDLVDCDLFEWEDHNRSYEYYDITKDSEELLRNAGKPINRNSALFSKMVHSPPPILDSSN
jgi:hypothetical protein